MSQRSDKIRKILEAEFRPDFIHIEDESWKHAGHAGAKEHGGGHFRIEIRAKAFNGLTRLQRHRLVMQALTPLFPAKIHAASVTAEASEA